MKQVDGPIRVLVVDDSIVVRELLQEMLSSDPAVKVVGEAVNGKEAVEKAVLLSPHLITLDVRMPVMDGLDAVREIMAVKPTPILVITSSLSKDELDISFEAIQRGALDVMLKPTMESRSRYLEIRDALVEKVKLLSRIRVISHFGRKPRRTRSIPKETSKKRDSILCIGSSLGGPAAVMTVLKSLTPNFPAPIVMVQHISAGFGEGFTAWLDKNLPFEVVQAKHGDRLKPGRILVAPDAYHMVLEPGRVALTDDPPINSCKPAVDALFFSAAELYRENVLAAVLTGMGSDGAKGAEAIKKAGGHVIVQDRATCVVFGMPQAVIKRKAADEVLPLNEIPEALVSHILGM